MKKIFFIILAVIVVILVFSLGTFGVEAESVLSGYENTRRYAQDAKMLTVAVDTYKAEVDKQAEIEKKLESREPSDVTMLGSYGTVLSHEDYENYTESLVVAEPGSFPYADYTGNYGNKLTKEMSTAAKFDEVLHYLKDPDTTDGNEIELYLAGQCAAFANWYVNQVSYRDIVEDSDKYLLYGIGYVNLSVLPSDEDGTYWVSHISSGVYLNDADAAKKFFNNVTPGTFVRVGKGYHSYIILGADDSRVIMYDCNTNGDVYGSNAILLHDMTWEDFVERTHLAKGIYIVMSPPNTNLPDGCFNTKDGEIKNAKEATN